MSVPDCASGRHPLDLIEPCVSIDADLAAITEGFCPACHGRLIPHAGRNPHVRCPSCQRCMQDLSREWGEPVYSTWTGCPA